MTRLDSFVAEENTYKSCEHFAWALFKERETLTEAVSSLEARITELEGENAAMKDGEYYLDALRYREALKQIEAHWNGVDGEISPTLMANIAINALHS